MELTKEFFHDKIFSNRSRSFDRLEGIENV